MGRKALLLTGIIGIMSAFVFVSKNNSQQRFANLPFSEEQVEVLTACESVGWWENNGNCVKNNKGVYFCKEDSWREFTDCLQ